MFQLCGISCHLVSTYMSYVYHTLLHPYVHLGYMKHDLIYAGELIKEKH